MGFFIFTDIRKLQEKSETSYTLITEEVEVTGLMKYRNKSFWEGHKTITFDTLTYRHQYKVIAR